MPLFIITRQNEDRKEYLGLTRTGDMWHHLPENASCFQSKEEANQHRSYNHPNDTAVRVEKIEGERG